jgi:uncharacterized protein YggE
MRTALLLFAAASLVLAGTVAAQNDTADSKAGKLSVTGAATVQVTPDVGRVSMTVQTTRPTGSEACDVVAQQAASLTSAVKGLVEDAEVSTVGLSLQRNVTWGGDNNGEQFNGYVCSNTISVKITDTNATALGAALGAVNDLAAEQEGSMVTVNQLSTELSPELRERETNKARTAAVDNGKATAKTLAKAAGVKLGAIRSITDNNVAPTPSPNPMPAMEAAAGDAAKQTATPVSIGTTDLTATVALEYAFDN